MKRFTVRWSYRFTPSSKTLAACGGILGVDGTSSFISSLPAKPKGAISLPSVCPSVIPLSDFQTLLCSAWMKILNWNLTYDYISMSYRPSLSFVTLDQLLTELFPLMFTFSFPDFFWHWMKWRIWNFLYGFLLNSCRSSSSFGTFDLFLTELWPFIKRDIQLSDSTRKPFGLES